MRNQHDLMAGNSIFGQAWSRPVSALSSGEKEKVMLAWREEFLFYPRAEKGPCPGLKAKGKEPPKHF